MRDHKSMLKKMAAIYPRFPEQVGRKQVTHLGSYFSGRPEKKFNAYFLRTMGEITNLGYKRVCGVREKQENPERLKVPYLKKYKERNEKGQVLLCST